METIRTKTFLDEISELLLSAPTPMQIADFQLSDVAQQRISYLLDANRNGTLTPDERNELDEVGRWEHVITILKLNEPERVQIREELIEAGIYPPAHIFS